MRWANGNMAAYTLDELHDIIRSAVPSTITDGDLTDVLLDTLTMLTSWFKNTFYITIPNACCGQCEVELGGVDIREITNVEVMNCGVCTELAPCWSNLPWFKLVGTRLETSPLDEGASIRIEFLEDGPVRRVGVAC
jgi:hypothetical protein